MKFKEYYETNEFATLASISTKTLSRLKKEILSENPNSKKIKEGSPNEYHHSLLKRFISEEMFKVLMTNKSLRNTIKCLKKTNTIEHHLFHLPWTYFGTVAYDADLSRDRCFDIMHKIYNVLEKKYGDKTNIRMFFSTESFSVKEGSHNHFVLYISNPMLHASIKKDISVMLEGNRIHMVVYDEDQPCIFYNGKEGLKGTDWDLLGNNLSNEGITSSN